MPLGRRRSHYQQFTEFKRGRVTGLRESGFSFHDIVKRLDRNASSAHDLCSNSQGVVLPQEDRVLGSHVELLRGKTTAFYVWLWRIALCRWRKFELQLRAFYGLEAIVVFYASNVKLELIGGRNGDLLKAVSDESRFCRTRPCAGQKQTRGTPVTKLSAA
ncbi:uncharacterized protein TNCV_3938831 [Trichonephila clavipes]|nr:uncharacterized protein TNCV_3938831 [Trichonephila clavipes]